MLDFWPCFLCTDLLDAWNGFHKAHLCGVAKGTWPANHPDHLNNPRMCEDWYEYLYKKRVSKIQMFHFQRLFGPLFSRHTHICHLSTFRSVFPAEKHSSHSISLVPISLGTLLIIAFEAGPTRDLKDQGTAFRSDWQISQKMGALLMEIWTKMISLVLLYNTDRVSSTF